MVIGVDPGFKGGVAKLISGQFSGSIPMPFLDKTSWPFPEICVESLQKFVAGGPPIRAVFIERVSAMPKQGVTGVFRFGFNTGALTAFFRTMKAPVYTIPSAVWKASLALGRDKGDSILKAELLFPEGNFRRDGEAEAALIAHFGFTHFTRLK